jgi:hypothetical protein
MRIQHLHPSVLIIHFDGGKLLVDDIDFELDSSETKSTDGFSMFDLSYNGNKLTNSQYIVNHYPSC